MRYLRRFSPFVAIRDLRQFLAQRQPYEMWFFVLAIMATCSMLYAFWKDSYVERPYKPDIIYVDQWPADRTDAQIVAKQKIDQVAVDKRNAEIAEKQAKVRAQFKRVDDKLKAMGL